MNSSDLKHSDPRAYGLDLPVYRPADAMKKMGCGRTKFYQHVKNGEIELVKSGGQSLVFAQSISAYFDRLRRQKAA